jgi:hypothetical protein
MKFFRFIFPLFLSILIASTLTNCVNTIDEPVLDSELFGTWKAVDSQNIEHIVTFNDDGTYIQEGTQGVKNYLWEIVDGQIRLYTDDGSQPTSYHTYKVEGDAFYFWIESLNKWGIPYYKQ